MQGDAAARLMKAVLPRRGFRKEANEHSSSKISPSFPLTIDAAMAHQCCFLKTRHRGGCKLSHNSELCF